VRIQIVALFALASALLLPANPALAHHAGGIYDREHPVTLTGTVTEYEFANPHVVIHFDVKEENGEVSHWYAQTAPPQRMYRVGWTRDSLKAGDTITVTGFPAKDGKKMMSVRKLKPPAGVADLTEGAE